MRKLCEPYGFCIASHPVSRVAMDSIFSLQFRPQGYGGIPCSNINLLRVHVSIIRLRRLAHWQEWNVFCFLASLYLFGYHSFALPPALDPMLVAFLVLVLALIPVLGQIAPSKVRDSLRFGTAMCAMTAWVHGLCEPQAIIERPICNN